MEMNEMLKPGKSQEHTIASMIKTLCCTTWPARGKGKRRGHTLATNPPECFFPERTHLRTKGNGSFGSLYKALNNISSGYLLYLKKF